jgi:hypothetical protein
LTAVNIDLRAPKTAEALGVGLAGIMDIGAADG